MLKTQKPPAARRGVLASIAGATAAASLPMTSAAASNEAEWPEFREWYALMLEEERLYMSIATGSDIDEKREEIAEKMWPLDQAMHTRAPRSLTQLAILGILSLYWCDKSVGKFQGRMLELGCDRDLENPAFCHRPAAHLIEAVVRMAVEKDLLPGVVVYGDGGNA